MKYIFTLSLFLPFLGFGQLTDTTCIKSRWIALKPNEINKNIFLLDSTFDKSLDLVFVIKELVERGIIKIYTQNHSPNDNYDWYYIPYDQKKEEKLKDSLNYWGYNQYFEISVQSDIPEVDEYGEHRILTLPDGTQTFMYPMPIIYTFPSKECDEIRIKENRIYNDTTQKNEFVPVGLSFYFKGNDYYRGHEKFWVDLNELFNALQKKEEFPWYKDIINRNYNGFQYMQVSCYDQEVKY